MQKSTKKLKEKVSNGNIFFKKSSKQSSSKVLLLFKKVLFCIQARFKKVLLLFEKLIKGA
jgi:hypothetical protein